MARSIEFGGGPIGSVNLGAGGDNPLSFRDMPFGPCDAWNLTLGISVRSTGSAFEAVWDTGTEMAAEGVDDVDLLLNSVYSKLYYQIDKHESPFNMSPAQLRTALAVLELRDILSTLLDGTEIPASTDPALAVLFTITIPIQLNAFVLDGNMFANGSERLKTGTLFLNTNANITPNVVLANGTAAVSANIVRAVAIGGTGDAGDVGATWTVLRQLGLPTVYNFELDRPRLFLADVLPVSSNPASGITIGEFETLNPSDFAAYFTRQRLGAFGNAADVTARLTPYMWPSPNSRVEDIVARLLKGSPRLVIASGVSSVGVYDFQFVGAGESAQAGVATAVGGGGDVSVATVKPQSVTVGAKVPSAVAQFLPKRIASPTTQGAGAMLKPTAVKSEAAKATTTRTTLISLARAKK